MEAKALETSTTSAELASATEIQNIMKKYGDSKIVSQISKLILNLKKECDQSLLDKSKTSPLTPEEERFLATPIKRQKITDISCDKEILVKDTTTPRSYPVKSSICPVTPPIIDEITTQKKVTEITADYITTSSGQFTYPEFSDVSKLVSDLDNLKLF